MRNKILQVEIDALSTDQAVTKADELIKAGRPSQVVTVNPEILMACRADSVYREIVNSADLNIPDGAGVIWAGRFLKKPFPNRIPGVEFCHLLFKLAQEKDYSIFLLGGKTGVAAQAAHNIRQEFPQINIIGTASGSNDDETAKMVLKAHPDILLVAFGAPKQEAFIFDFIVQPTKLGLPYEAAPKLAIGVGGTLDFLSGKIPRAPKWMQKIGLEWLFRLIREPKRLGRIFTAVVKFPLAVIIEKFKSS